MNREFRYVGRRDREEQEPWKVGVGEITETGCYTTRTRSKKMDTEQVAIERLKAASEMSLAVYSLPLVVTTSGGKDIEKRYKIKNHLPKD